MMLPVHKVLTRRNNSGKMKTVFKLDAEKSDKNE